MLTTHIIKPNWQGWTSKPVRIQILTVKLSNETSYDEIMSTMEKASKNDLKNILGFSTDDVVSQDFIGDKRTSIFDARAAIELNSKFYKVVSWYDNETGYSNKLVELALKVNNI